jgi:hypothetical protein
MKIMFLGGPLDHAIRAVEGRPGAIFYPLTGEPGGRSMYRLTAVRADPKYLWWVYVLDGHNPPVQHLLDGMPDDIRTVA